MLEIEPITLVRILDKLSDRTRAVLKALELGIV